MKKVSDMSEKEFIEHVANACIGHMSEEDKQCFRDNPNSDFHHFGYGAYIRNNYIYNKKLSFGPFIADDLSNAIIERIIAIINGNI